MGDEWDEILLAQKLKENPDLSIDIPKQGLYSKSDVVKPKANKYHVSNKEDRTYRGIVFKSKKEALFASDLDLRVKAGDIDFWLYEGITFLLPGGVKYKPDFITFKNIETERIYKNIAGYFVPMYDCYRVKIYEVKGFKTQLGEVKRKQACELYHMEIHVV